MQSMTSSRRLGLLIALAIFVADQAVKWAVTGPIALDEVGQIALLPIFNLTWVQNYGVSMGFLTAGSETCAGRWSA